MSCFAWGILATSSLRYSTLSTSDFNVVIQIVFDFKLMAFVSLSSFSSCFIRSTLGRMRPFSDFAPPRCESISSSRLRSSSWISGLGLGKNWGCDFRIVCRCSECGLGCALDALTLVGNPCSSFGPSLAFVALPRYLTAVRRRSQLRRPSCRRHFLCPSALFLHRCR